MIGCDIYSFVKLTLSISQKCNIEDSRCISYLHKSGDVPLRNRHVNVSTFFDFIRQGAERCIDHILRDDGMSQKVKKTRGSLGYFPLSHPDCFIVYDCLL